jgi:hypothetical protein
VRVPDDAGTGMARVTFSFDAWQQAGVARNTIAIPISESQEKENVQEDHSLGAGLPTRPQRVPEDLP